MRLSDEERIELPRELFALAARRLEYGADAAMEGAGRNVEPERLSALSTKLHDVGLDVAVIADAIAALAEDNARRCRHSET